ncbi:pilus assembly protein TadG-related protein [Salinibacterium sp. ZJ70]|uniref:pilus assembly protein TadG-related protein n=1 Tax=Salinibacterium sp. ZJ70 TaxID=2708084 RepID=UPI00141E074D|nr:pilus assembly protein TadG-related protein [Salinibacterium sp. ZJ70]
MSRAGIARRLRDDDGSTLPLVAFYAFLALATVLIVTAATSLYLEKKRLFTLADGAALVGAEAFELSAVSLASGSPRPLLDDTDVESAVSEYLAAAPITGFDGLAIDDASSPDGRSATVTLSATWHPPVVTIFVPDGIRIDATATARSVFG